MLYISTASHFCSSQKGTLFSRALEPKANRMIVHAVGRRATRRLAPNVDDPSASARQRSSFCIRTILVALSFVSTVALCSFESRHSPHLPLVSLHRPHREPLAEQPCNPFAAGRNTVIPAAPKRPKPPRPRIPKPPQKEDGVANDSLSGTPSRVNLRAHSASTDGPPTKKTRFRLTTPDVAMLRDTHGKAAVSHAPY